ncbi:MAG: ROK family protein, partial [Rhodospirillales bacterium]
AQDSGCGEDAPVGVGIPGALSLATGLIKNANSTCLIGRPFDRDLAAATGRPVRLANDADCFTMSEATDGAGAGHAVVFGVILGTGVGGGITVNGRLLAGRNAIAGEWGHNPLPWPQFLDGRDERPGPKCYCGKLGCIETFVSGPGLERDFEAASGRRLAAAEIVRLSDDGDADAAAAMARYSHRLARALATVINVLDPGVIVLGGGMSNARRLCDAVPRLWGEFVFSGAVTTPLRPARHGDSSGVRGAAWLWES